MDIKDLLKLTRFEHALMLALAVLIGQTIVLGSIPPLNLILALSLLVPIFSEMGAFALNDYFDIDTDRLNKKKDRPLVEGRISPGFALFFSVASIILSTVFAFFINFNAFAIVVIFNAMAVIYNWRMKDLPLVGNVYIALTMAIPFIFGNYVVSDELTILAVVLAALGFVAGLAREIIKSVQDMEGDMAARDSRTLPVMIGRKKSLVIAVILYLFFIPLSAMPFFMGIGSSIAILIIALADMLILRICYRTLKHDNLDYARHMSLVAFFFGLVGILIAIIL